MKNVRAAFLALLLATTTFAGDTDSPGYEEPPPPPPPAEGTTGSAPDPEPDDVLSSILQILSELF